MKSVVYLDNAASAPLRPEVIEALSTSYEMFANPSAVHALGQEARKRVERARGAVAALIGADLSEIIFTSGATEANNLALRGTIEPLLDRGDRPHAVTTALEHPSVSKTFELLAARGLELTVIPPDKNGIVQARDVLAAVRPETALVSMISASNELGSRQPVEAVGKGLLTSAPHKTLFHVDAVQSVVSTDMTLVSTHADLLTVSGHKIGGPKGIGALAVRRGVKLVPILAGGGHERGLRSGTENVSGILGMGAAAETLLRARPSEISRYDALRSRFLRALPVGATSLLDEGTPVAPHVIAVACSGKESDWIVLLLSRAGVMVSTGSACKTGSRGAPSGAKALGLDEARAKSILRVSFGWSTSESDVDACIKALESSLQK